MPLSLVELEPFLQHKPDCELAASGLFKNGEPRQMAVNIRWNHVSMRNDNDWRQAECTCKLADVLAFLRGLERDEKCEKCGGSGFVWDGESEDNCDCLKPAGRSAVPETPAPDLREFVVATINAVGDMVSKQEAIDAILREWPKETR